MTILVLQNRPCSRVAEVLISRSVNISEIQCLLLPSPTPQATPISCVLLIVIFFGLERNAEILGGSANYFSGRQEMLQRHF